MSRYLDDYDLHEKVVKQALEKKELSFGLDLESAMEGKYPDFIIGHAINFAVSAYEMARDGKYFSHLKNEVDITSAHKEFAYRSAVKQASALYDIAQELRSKR